ncbi:serine-aspartate repeat-containing protein D [Clostridium sp. CAG:452]|nr:serine-aspartate repeat-containing protein D [Clostridium sp. CAG:452]
MKRIKILLMALIVALISIAVLNPNAIYAAEEKRDLTYQRTRPYSEDNGDNNIDNEEYTFARHKDGQEFKYSIVKIFDYNKRELETPYKKFEDSFYCIRGGKGFGSVEFGDNSSANSTKYTVIENMKSNANEVIAKYKELYNINLDRTENITFNEKTYNNVNIYNAMLWIADNAYLPVNTDKYNAQEYKTELLTKIGIAKVNQGMITDDDLEVIQQLAFWYFANYDENGKNESVSTTNPTPVNWLAINESNDVFGTRRANYLNRIYQYFIEGALKEGSDSTSTIRETTNSDSVNIEFDKNIKFGVEDKSSTGTKPNPYENYYLIGPFKITTNDARYNDFELALKDGKGNIVNQYFYFEQTEDTLKRMQIFDVINSTGNKVELEKVTYNNEYYIKLYKSAMEFVDIDCSKFSLKVSKTGKWATANFLYATGNDQAVIEIKRDKAEAEDEISTEVPKRFDLALRKFITAIKRAEKNIEVADRTPRVDTTTLINGIKDDRTGEVEYTATYTHPKDKQKVETGDIVTYKIRVYNEGQVDGTATEVTDYLPAGLELVAGSAINTKYGWKTGEQITLKDGSKVTPITSNYLKDTTIKAFDRTKTSETTEGIWQKAEKGEGGLYYADLEVECKVVAIASGVEQNLRNIAAITVDSGDDDDSVPEKPNLDDYTPPTDNSTYQEDDDDYEDLVLPGKTFDLALRKYITEVNGTKLEDTRVPDIDVTKLASGEATTADYKHKKYPVEVKTEDIVTYRFTVYNEGDIEGYVYSITDYLPQGLEFDAKSNPEFIEAKTSGEYTAEELEGKEYIYSINKEKNTITISKIPAQGETGLQPYLFGLNPFDGEKLDSKSIDIKFKVSAETSANDMVLTNIATMDYTSAPRPQEEKIKDRDSKPENFTEPTAEDLLEPLPGYKGNEENKNDLTDSKYHYKGQEDDDDFEKIIIKGTPFDLSLRKFITKLNGTELKDEKDRTPKINTSKLNTIDSTTGKKITTAEYVHPKDAVTVRKGDIVTYKIRVYNEGDRNGYATEVTDYLPEGLGFLPNYTNNSIWSIPKTTDEATGKEVLPEGIEIKNLVGENGFYKDESEINKDKIKLEDFKDPITGEVPTDYSQIQIVTGERAAISTKALKEKLIKAYKSQKADEDLWQQSTNDEKDGLFYQEVEITCIVLKENTYKGILKNVAEITEEYDENGNKIEQKGDDRDSEPKNVYEDDKHTPGKEENGYTPGEQDDDDFEQLQLKYFDLALRKFITKVDGEAPEASREPVPDVSTLIDGTYDRNGKKEHTATYNHPKDPLWVKNGSKVEYTIRVYNEGSEDGYAYEVSDDIPNGLVFEADDATNKAYGWVMYREMTEGDENIAKEDIIEYNGKKYVITTKAEEATMIRTRYLEKTLIKAFDPETKTLSYADVKVVFTIKEPKDFDKDRVIINQAQITEDSGDDEDSTPNEWQDEDDEDIEKVRIPIFDLSLLKWVTQSVVTVDGKTTTTNTGFKPNKGLTESTGEGIRNNNEPEPIAKVELDKKKLNKTVVKFVYKIRVTNEGEIPGYATEVTDYIPEGLEFHVEDGNNKQYGWVKSGDDKIVTRALETVLLNPGESKELEITFRWINSEKNLGQKINIAEISEDANDYNTDDIDSTPNNKENPYKEEQEDDDDFALVILSIKTGATQFMSYFTLITITLAIVGGGIILIKKYVLKS